MLITIITFIIILTALIFVHEIGHFWTARRNGVKVEEFGVGLPPRLIGIRRKKIKDSASFRDTGGRDDPHKSAIPKRWEWLWGGQAKAEDTENTIYSLNWLPIGGFVKIKGENDGELGKDSFGAQSLGRRALMLSAGVIMNVVFAAVLLALVFGIGFPAILDDDIDPARVSGQEIQIVSVIEGSPAAQKQIQPGDIITGLNNEKFKDVDEVQQYISSRGGQEINLAIRRGQEELTVTIAPVYLAEIDSQGLGVGLVEIGDVKYPWYEAIWRGLSGTVTLTIEIIKVLGRIIASLVSTGQVQEQISGPVGIAVLTGEVVDLGFVFILQFAAILSINLAIINILPFPALDGGRLLFIIIEKLRGRAVSKKIENIAHTVGFALLILLIIFVTFKDVSRFGDQILSAVQRVF